ncbi:hypothetical protein EVAR_70760_1 [Eumeta japonica]|uniref:Uncharacterized protein n=1 Tax=Eumeta variegata TaxID=151549 RepID=A0A4C1SGW7_EUMVA|nr:hypothetical protein EVAR_70760_1 [Eumeta japonica]
MYSKCGNFDESNYHAHKFIYHIYIFNAAFEYDTRETAKQGVKHVENIRIQHLSVSAVRNINSRELKSNMISDTTVSAPPTTGDIRLAAAAVNDRNTRLLRRRARGGRTDVAPSIT